MTSWRSLCRVVPWLVAPAFFFAACGQTDHFGGDPESAGQAAEGGSSMGDPLPAAGKPAGRAGTSSMPEGGTMPAVTIPGISTMPSTIMCGGEACNSVGTLLANANVDPCCADGECGVSTQFLALAGSAFAEECQPKHQPGERDASCPTSAAQMLPFMGTSVPVAGFVGCCRAETGTCGVIVDQLSAVGLAVASPELGCVDSAPFFDNVPGAACGEGAGGAPSAAGAGSVDTGGAGPTSAGGAGGAP